MGAPLSHEQERYENRPEAHLASDLLKDVVEMKGFEPSASALRRQRSPS